MDKTRASEIARADEVTASVPGHDGPVLSREEIEAILEREAAGLPPEPGAEPPPLRVVTREPGTGRYGRWTAWIWLVVFVFLVIMHSLRG
jgi:hypothetical protein